MLFRSLFSFAASPYILWPLIQYLKKHTQCKIVLLIADDVFGSYDRCTFYRRVYLKREFAKCILSADKLYGISDESAATFYMMAVIFGNQDVATAPGGGKIFRATFLIVLQKILRKNEN